MDDSWVCDEALPCLASCVENGGIVFKYPVGQKCSSQILPDIFNRVQFGRFGWQQENGDVSGPVQFAGGVPPGPIHQNHRM